MSADPIMAYAAKLPSGNHTLVYRDRQKPKTGYLGTPRYTYHVDVAVWNGFVVVVSAPTLIVVDYPDMQ